MSASGAGEGAKGSQVSQRSREPATTVSSTKSTPIKSPQTKRTKKADPPADPVARKLSGRLQDAADEDSPPAGHGEAVQASCWHIYIYYIYNIYIKV